MWQKLVVNLFITLLAKASPVIKEELINALDQVEAKAKSTPNPIDDLLIAFARDILNL